MSYLLLIFAAVAFAALLYLGRGYLAWLAAAGLSLAAWTVAGIESWSVFFASTPASRLSVTTSTFKIDFFLVI